MPGNNGNAAQKNSSHPEQKPTLSWSTPPNASPAPAAKSVAVVIKETKAKTAQPKASMNKMIGIFIGSVALLALVIAGVIWLGNRNPQPTSEQTGAAQTGIPSEQESPSSSGTAVSANGLSIPSPQAAGLQIAVASASVTSPTWVVIYENHNGQPGNALGAALFTPERRSGTIDLLRGTLPGQTYFAGEARDDGDHIFSLQRDPAVRDADGNPIWIEFQTR